jgi:TolA-binding protein
MSGQRFLKAILVASALMLAVPAGAQQSGTQTVSNSDVQRLQDDVYQAGSDIARLRSTDANAAARLQDELDDLRDEVTYLKVKMRKEGSVSRSDYADVRTRLQDVRSRARQDAGASSSSSGTAPNDRSRSRTGTSSSSDVYDTRPSDSRPGDSRTTSSSRGQTSELDGKEIDVRIERELNSSTAQVEDRFEGTTVVDMYEGNRVLIPAGSVMRGVISSVDKASRTDRKGSLTVAFDQVTVRGRDYPMRGTVTQALESEGIKGEVAKIGAGSAVGAIIGGIIGGMKGAVLGVLIGGGGTIAATEGKDVSLPPGTILRVRFDQPPDIR